MSGDGPIRRLSAAQAAGADPLRNVWMSASAGTGKTQVLTDRILRLLLEGVKPQSILAITFTKAGAAEMARRIRSRLAAWVQMKDKELKPHLFAIHARGHLDQDMLAHARTLFASVIDSPGGGLAIQTIHSFCQSILSSFPEEAGLAPGFRALEDRESAELQRDVLSDLIGHAQARGELGFLGRLRAVALALGDGPTQAYLFRCAAAHDALDALSAGIGPWLREQFGLARDISPEAWLTAGCALPEGDEQAIRDLIAANIAWGGVKGMARGHALGDWLAADAAGRAATIDQAMGALIGKSTGKLYGDYIKNKALIDVTDLAVRIADLLSGLRDTARHIIASDRLADALEVGRHYARAYQERKRRDGCVDYDDLIARTNMLLSSQQQQWIRYKLDTRIDHILVDEAQDTNAQQWAIVRALANEFFAGEGAKDDVLRTLFVVGDTKQAIYGFQGTSPIFFEAERARYRQAGRDADRPFSDVAIDTNYRSSPPILKLVDTMIAMVGAEQFGLDTARVSHEAQASDAPGRVTLWPLEPHGQAGDVADADEETDEEGWIDSATRRIAVKIGRSVARWIDHGIDGAPVKPSDVMILVRKRSDIAALIVSRLLANGVAVAGVDRLKLSSPIAVQDLLGAMRFATQPHDDLNLASLLVSPLIGWSHQDLIDHGWRMDDMGNFPASHGRPVSLWRHLNRQEHLGERLSPLRDLLNMAGYASPHGFLETLLSGPMQGRAKLLARLGNGALDPIEELVSQALTFESRDGVSLHRFLAWFDAGTGDIKRELAGGGDAVRVMTAHGAKGLQARIVILADAAGNPQGKRDDVHMWPGDNGAIPLLAVKQEDRPAVLAASAAAKQAEDMKEHNRLLYVAATRAERMLFVAGALPAHGALPDGNWYEALKAAAAALGAREEDDPVWGSALSYAARGKEDRKSDKDGPVLPVMTAIPAWVRDPAPDEPRPLRPLAPSADAEKHALSVPQPPSTPARDAAMARGTLVHTLFERLPDTAPDARRDTALRWLAARAPHMNTAEREAMVASVLGVLDAPEHAALFGPDSLAEAPFSALVDGRVIAGTVDRLLVSARDVRVIDYKSGRFVPASVGEVPVGYLKQMAAYVAALRVIFPNHAVSAALLFSEGPRLILLPDTVIEQHKPKLAEV
ncbi:MAG: double-strand break repair helicase AddA [Sphingopyxis sp.]